MSIAPSPTEIVWWVIALLAAGIGGAILTLQVDSPVAGVVVASQILVLGLVLGVVSQ